MPLFSKSPRAMAQHQQSKPSVSFSQPPSIIISGPSAHNNENLNVNVQNHGRRDSATMPQYPPGRGSSIPDRTSKHKSTASFDGFQFPTQPQHHAQDDLYVSPRTQAATLPDARTRRGSFGSTATPLGSHRTNASVHSAGGHMPRRDSSTLSVDPAHYGRVPSPSMQSVDEDRYSQAAPHGRRGSSVASMSENAYSSGRVQLMRHGSQLSARTYPYEPARGTPSTLGTGPMPVSALPSTPDPYQTQTQPHARSRRGSFNTSVSFDPAGDPRLSIISEHPYSESSRAPSPTEMPYMGPSRVDLHRPSPAKRVYGRVELPHYDPSSLGPPITGPASNQHPHLGYFPPAGPSHAGTGQLAIRTQGDIERVDERIHHLLIAHKSELAHNYSAQNTLSRLREEAADPRSAPPVTVQYQRDYADFQKRTQQVYQGVLTGRQKESPVAVAALGLYAGAFQKEHEHRLRATKVLKDIEKWTIRLQEASERAEKLHRELEQARHEQRSLHARLEYGDGAPLVAPLALRR